MCVNTYRYGCTAALMKEEVRIAGRGPPVKWDTAIGHAAEFKNLNPEGAFENEY